MADARPAAELFGNLSPRRAGSGAHAQHHLDGGGVDPGGLGGTRVGPVDPLRPRRTRRGRPGRGRDRGPAGDAAAFGPAVPGGTARAAAVQAASDQRERQRRWGAVFFAAGAAITAGIVFDQFTRGKDTTATSDYWDGTRRGGRPRPADLLDPETGLPMFGNETEARWFVGIVDVLVANGTASERMVVSAKYVQRLAGQS